MIHPTPKQARALELRRAGKKWTEIAKELGTTRANARLWAERAQLKEFRLQEAAKYLDGVPSLEWEKEHCISLPPAQNPYLFTDVTVGRLYGIEE